jgi:hypothetical protein
VSKSAKVVLGRVLIKSRPIGVRRVMSASPLIAARKPTSPEVRLGLAEVRLNNRPSKKRGGNRLRLREPPTIGAKILPIVGTREWSGTRTPSLRGPKPPIPILVKTRFALIYAMARAWGLALFTVYPSLGIILLGMHRSRDVADPAMDFLAPEASGRTHRQTVCASLSYAGSRPKPIATKSSLRSRKPSACQ